MKTKQKVPSSESHNSLPYLTYEPDTEQELIGQINSKGLLPRLTVSSVTKRLTREQAKYVNQACKTGFSPLLVVDLKTKTAFVELRKHVPEPLNPRTLKIWTGETNL